MKDILEKLDLIELFAYLCPGAIVLFSTVLWMDQNTLNGLKEIFKEQQILGAIMSIIVSYAVGVMIALWSGVGADRYIRAHYKPNAAPKEDWEALGWLALNLFHWIPVPRMNASIVEGQLRIAEALTRYTGLNNLSLMQNPWDRLATYRTIVSGRVGDEGRPILTEAEWVHRRLLFAIGVSLAVLLLALQALLGFLLILFHKLPVLAVLPSPHYSPGRLVLLTFIGLVSSFGLREMAGRWWEYELLLTCSLSRSEQEREDAPKEQGDDDSQKALTMGTLGLATALSLALISSFRQRK